MRGRPAILLIFCFCLPISCKPKPKSTALPDSTASQEEFDEALTRLFNRPTDSIRFRDPEVEQLMGLACSSPRLFDQLIDRVAQDRNLPFIQVLFGYGNMERKDCPLGEACS